MASSRTENRIGLGALALACLWLVGCSEAAPGIRGATPGEPAPTYGAPTLAGDSIRLADLRGKVVLLNVWATWCPPCREEMPGIEALHAEFAPQGLEVLAVSIDRRNADTEIRRFVEDYGLSFTILHDADERVTHTFRTIGVPETFLIGRDGVLLKRWIGKIDATSDEVREPVRAALLAGGAE